MVITGNEVSANLVKVTTFQNITLNGNISDARQFCFDVPSDISSFRGREQFLSNLHQILRQNRSGRPVPVTILSQLKVISGMSGVGKTQAVLKYISKFGYFYSSIIWIKGEDKNTMKNSFLKLAKNLRILPENSTGQVEDLDSIVNKVYEKLGESPDSKLIVFDNADDFERGIEKFLPPSFHPVLNNLMILVTSQNQEWNRNFEEFQVLPLDVLTNEEAMKVLHLQLYLPYTPEIEEEAREFIDLIGGLPLALQQSIAYIKEKKSLVGHHYAFSDYIKDFKLSMDEILHYDRIPGSPSTMLVTWISTSEKIEALENGELAIKILEALAFLCADNVPVSLIQFLFTNLETQELNKALSLLKKYSLVKFGFVSDKKFVSIHQQLQFVLMTDLKKYNKIDSVFNNVLERCRIIFRSDGFLQNTDNFSNIDHLVNNPYNIVPGNENWFDFLCEFSDFLYHAGKYTEFFDLCAKINKNIDNCAGKGQLCQKALNIQLYMVRRLSEMGKYGEASSLGQNVVGIMKTNFGPEHEATLTAKFELAGLLYRQEKYSKSLSLLLEVIEEMQTVLGENHQSPLLAQGLLGLVYSKQENFPAALKLFEEVERKQADLLGVDHPDTLYTTQNKGVTLMKMGEVQQAFKIFRQVHRKIKRIFGENHPDAIRVLDWISTALEKLGKLSKALKVQKEVLERRKQALGENHPDTKFAEQNIKVFEYKVLLNGLDYILD